MLPKASPTTLSKRHVLSATQTRHLVPTDPSSPIVYQGVIQLDVDVNPVDKELTPALIRLETGAAERLFDDVPYIGLKSGQQTGIRMSFNIPPQGISNPSVFQLRLLILGRATGTLTQLVASCRRLAMPSVGGTESLLPTDSSFTINTTYAVTNGQLVEAQSTPVVVYPGDTLFVTLTRPSDVSFNGEIGLVRITGVVSTNGSSL